ncbi:MAG: YidC/Oxa1 family insertase periplasmic-domain containing protein [Candidatus Omnitrophica bacterium]|nr:YidC/Oxa1 family insertase periplasmic-domain containing protein [Candidatus Omnitrophota bacterium]
MKQPRLFLAIVLSLAVLVGYRFYLQQFIPAEQSPAPRTEKGLGDQGASYSEMEHPVDKSKAPKAEDDVFTTGYNEDDTVWPGPQLKVYFDKTYGFIKVIEMSEYEKREGEGLVEVLAVKRGMPGPGAMSLNEESLVLRQAPRVGENQVLLDYAPVGEIHVQARWQADPQLMPYGMRVEWSIRNTGQDAKRVSVQRLALAGLVLDGKRDQHYTQLRVGDSVEGQKVKLSKNLEKGWSEEVSWVGMANKYFVVAWKESQLKDGMRWRAEGRGREDLRVWELVDDIVLDGGETISIANLMYIGPYELQSLGAVSPDFQGMIDSGVFGRLAKALRWILGSLERVFKNYGVAIIVLTIMVNIILAPLSLKSLSSMRKMQQIQPLIEGIRTKYKESPERMSKEMMALYKEHRVNPMGGCLPLLIQMPIFIALYRVLGQSVELWGAGFLWIKDLSAPDHFWKIPAALPIVGEYVNLLPLMMMGAMVMQQRLSQKNIGSGGTDQQQQMQKMMTWFPLMLGFVFYNLPSGLVLYWLTNTIVMIGNQLLFAQKVGANA